MEKRKNSARRTSSVRRNATPARSARRSSSAGRPSTASARRFADGEDRSAAPSPSEPSTAPASASTVPTPALTAPATAAPASAPVPASAPGAPAAAARERWKPGTLIYPLPAVLVSCGATPEEYNLLTVAWTGTVCTNPPMCSISLRPERHSYEIIRRTGAFVINLTTQALARATDWCGVRSGRDCDKFREAGLTPLPSDRVEAPLVAESPVNIECRVRQRLPLGSHDLFLAEVVGVQVDPAYIDPATGRFDLERAGLIAYSHGEYFTLGRSLGRFGWSVRKKSRPAAESRPAGKPKSKSKSR